eukprot:1199159-Prymnesium_polylepis.1
MRQVRMHVRARTHARPYTACCTLHTAQSQVLLALSLAAGGTCSIRSTARPVAPAADSRARPIRAHDALWSLYSVLIDLGCKLQVYAAVCARRVCPHC